jgi:hypothetical protein
MLLHDRIYAATAGPTIFIVVEGDQNGQSSPNASHASKSIKTLKFPKRQKRLPN